MSQAERLILEDIEAALRRDRRFERACMPSGAPWLAVAMALLPLASVFLMVIGMHPYVGSRCHSGVCGSPAVDAAPGVPTAVPLVHVTR